MSAAATPLDAAIHAERYDAAALRLLLGLCAALEAGGPRTRDELVHWLTVDSTPARAVRGDRS